MGYFENEDAAPLFALIASAAVKHLVNFLWRNRRPPGSLRVGTLKSIAIYPVKSMSGISLPEVECSYSGPRNGCLQDRTWIVTYGAGNRFVTGRQEPKLTSVRCSRSGDFILLDSDGVETLKMPIEIENIESYQVKAVRVHGIPLSGVDCGDDAANWIDRVLNKRGHRILHHIPALPRRLTSIGATAFKRSFYHAARPEDEVAYQDSAPFSLGTDASLGNLCKRVGREIPEEQFRHTFEISALVPAFEEDSWKDIIIGSVRFVNFAPIEKCLMSVVDPRIGAKTEDDEPLATLKQYRNVYPDMFGHNAAFGRLLLLEKPGIVRVGDPVFACKAQ
ncbi:hypothetical protein CAPTEDRAFT_91125 [Capitella teleta]|uniref:MOSC domain-containing protein n=1 Tax=Capitella teleta TaxID=283909 RepID=R7TNR8_CAPTE|nr:hypothetical protein CAPTEDRAFT_91125 [Capitella teleta]|eukprot:ELT95518.1 hypothetical protein CAPTEDRAFT_91125 [Capitella teleta]